MRRRLLLFDIDGTLIRAGGMGGAALNEAFQEVLGLPDALGGLRLDGRTDRQIVRLTLQAHGFEFRESLWNQIHASYVKCLELEIEARMRGELCPGILELLEILAKREDCALALLTGNLEAGARLKLSAFGLWDYFLFGAYGCDHEERPALVPIALERASRHFSESFGVEQTVLIGDTPADVQAAAVSSCASVAVATGRFSREQLSLHQPTWMLDSLENVPLTLQALGLGAR